MIIRSGAATHVGNIRVNNEDAFFAHDPTGLYVVADGMGGHNAGEVASRIAVETAVDHITGTCGETMDDPAACLDPAVLFANQAVLDDAYENPGRRGMGTTLSMVKIVGNALYAANVGDSPIFLVRDGEVHVLYTSHTLEEAASWKPGPANKWEKPPTAHILTRAVGASKTVRPDFAQINAKPGDRLVLCSDGLSDKSSFTEIAKIAAAAPPEQACQILVDLALSRGGDDNITVIVVDLD